jgi:ketosteroid isomerase-like protein
MAEEDVRVVQRCLAAFDAGDAAAALGFLHEDVEYDLTTFPDGQVYRGRDGVREAFRVWLGAWDDYRQERDEVFAVGDRVVVCVRESGTGKGSGIRLERRQFGVWTVRDGSVVRIEFFPTRDEAVAAAERD